jgi:hypothetical protein
VFGATVLRRREYGCVARNEPPHGKTLAVQVRFRGRHCRCITILLDPGRFLNRLLNGLILMQPAIAVASIDCGKKCRGDGIGRG